MESQLGTTFVSRSTEAELDAARDAAAQALLDDIADLLHAERMLRWNLGDRIVQLGENIGLTKAYDRAAEVIGCSQRWTFELAKVARCFPEDKRFTEASWQLHRMAMAFPDPQAALEHAVETEQTPAEMLKAYRTRRGMSPLFDIYELD